MMHWGPPPSSIPPPPPVATPQFMQPSTSVSRPSYPTMVNGQQPWASDEMMEAELYMPPQRVMAPVGGRNSIRYRDLAPVQNTTKFFYVDNKMSDLDTYNEYANHSNFRTTVIHNQDLDPETAATESIQLDSRSCWGGDLKTSVKTNCPNVTRFFQSNIVRIKMMYSRDPSTTQSPITSAQPYAPQNAKYKWYDIAVPEGNYALTDLIDLLNEAVVQCYLSEGRQNNVLKSDIGVKFDTRYLDLMKDPVTQLVTPGKYVNKGYHPDVILLPGCAVDFTYSRMSLILGIGKREPYKKGFVITYEDLEGGNVPALMDVSSVDVNDADKDIVVEADIKPLYQDEDGVSYNVMTSPNGDFPVTAYRSWLIAYNQPTSQAYQNTLLTVPDMSGGLGAMYFSMPDTFTAPIGFKEDNTTNMAPVVGMSLMPTVAKSTYIGASSYVQRLENLMNGAVAAFNRFPNNEILKQAPPMNVSSVCDNQPAIIQQGTLPLKNSLAGLQRVLITDDQRRPIPYVHKSIATVQPRVLSSATLQ
ncbi:capsid protein III [Goose adenovirus 4]|uniref:Capsid protein III n=1 Tax=Goose adenovirus 4 TaxID=1193422 RepID=I3PMN0_9ADEN|nr:capsid protein III [Goose adenovirus 4]AFC40570.1 capsid protein III [Goose adenovirus 4]